METETTDPAGAGDSPARSLEWYVALAQLPGVPQRLQAACLETMREQLRNLSVTARRQHVWHSVQPAFDAAALEDVALGEAGVEETAAPA